MLKSLIDDKHIEIKFLFNTNYSFYFFTNLYI